MSIKENKVEVINILFLFLIIILLKDFTFVKNTATPLSLLHSLMAAIVLTLTWIPFIYPLKSISTAISFIAGAYVTSVLILWNPDLMNYIFK
jgi:hypothetical protein